MSKGLQASYVALWWLIWIDNKDTDDDGNDQNHNNKCWLLFCARQLRLTCIIILRDKYYHHLFLSRWRNWGSQLCAQNHKTSKWQSCDLNPSLSDSKSQAFSENEKGLHFLWDLKLTILFFPITKIIPIYLESQKSRKLKKEKLPILSLPKKNKGHLWAL